MAQQFVNRPVEHLQTEKKIKRFDKSDEDLKGTILTKEENVEYQRHKNK